LKALHVAAADRRFYTRELEQEIKNLMKIPLQEMQVCYSEPIAQLRTSISLMSSELAGHRVKIALLNRSYKSELDPLYKELNERRDRLHTIFAEKDEARDEFNQAKDDIDSWYAKSQGTFFGNGGKELPKHSFFGQSFGDLEGYKSDRDEAYGEIQRCSSEIGDVKRQMALLRSKIDGIKADRQRMFNLRKLGLNYGILKRTACDIDKRLNRLVIELKQKEREQAEYLESARHRNGVVSLESDIARIVSLRNEFLCSFDQPHARSARKLAHRDDWLRKHTQ
jgi:uncharacterized coiled-coil DUF342 family protein